MNNAGYMPINLLENANMDEWDRTVDINCKVIPCLILSIQGVLHGIGCCLPVMKKNRSGHIINISSDGGIRVGLLRICCISNLTISLCTVPRSILLRV